LIDLKDSKRIFSIKLRRECEKNFEGIERILKNGYKSKYKIVEKGFGSSISKLMFSEGRKVIGY
jgi:hypothetical protein